MKIKSILALAILLGTAITELPSFAAFPSKDDDGCYWKNVGGDYQWACPSQYSLLGQLRRENILTAAYSKQHNYSRQNLEAALHKLNKLETIIAKEKASIEEKLNEWTPLHECMVDPNCYKVKGDF